MLMFSGEGKDGRMFFLGLDQRNVDRLAADQPIRVNLADMGGPNAEVVILFDKTYRALFDKLKALGMIPPGVEYREPSPVPSRETW